LVSYVEALNHHDSAVGLDWKIVVRAETMSMNFNPHSVQVVYIEYGGTSRRRYQWGFIEEIIFV
jgi:hypothetical protein